MYNSQTLANMIVRQPHRNFPTNVFFCPNPNGAASPAESLVFAFLSKVDKNSLTVEALQLLRLVPEGYMPLPHQVGGHRHVDGKLGESGQWVWPVGVVSCKQAGLCLYSVSKPISSSHLSLLFKECRVS